MGQFIDNLKRLHTKISTYVALLASAAAAFWLQLTPEDQQAILASFPALKLIGPAVSFVAFVVARGIPQLPKA